MRRVSKTDRWARACSRCGKWCPSSYCADCYAKDHPDSRILRRDALIAAGQKNCTDCLRVLPLTEFTRNGSGKISSWCRGCQSQRDERRGRAKGLIQPVAEREELARLGLKRCADCGDNKPIGVFGRRPGTGAPKSYCPSCRTRRNKERRQADLSKARAYGRSKYHEHKQKHSPPPITDELRVKRAARWRTHMAVVRGKLVRPDVCSCCGGNAHRIEAHHDDYAKALDVIWLCASCHETAHSRHDAAQAALSFPLTKKVSEFLDWPQKEKEDVAC